MSAVIVLTLDDAARRSVTIAVDRLVRYEPHGEGTIVTYLTDAGLVSAVMREARADIEALVRDAVRPA